MRLLKGFKVLRPTSDLNKGGSGKAAKGVTANAALFWVLPDPQSSLPPAMGLTGPWPFATDVCRAQSQ